jgi:uncharacterized protein YdaT
MPFTGKDFAERNNKKLSGAAATKASDIANAMIRSGVEEGVAIATANKHGNRMQRSGSFKEHRQRRRES